ncbi:DNA-binding transcriptional regulator, GntR family [Saccharopolyspora antimicrobica]|uniref:DNA-binding transcriptional regulator, GntR family n=1 Tax=Saccharopolyspora antimicrobica TaxID=455193 RepID=A0A1I5HIP7_9PSEU|nr:GntR family transcriptional regulator [Saccharopolyspora antimicrobica]RKT85278.1 GntR family transcriptional regulator [Saccharopolyspora antimicrobica]SFO48009.1 DNA-binding transcriptional regulator, GntR family [Saccharopolyspora antimicrobica]
MAARRPQRRPVVELYERIVEAIRRGTYPPGSTLPAEPELAADLGVSRPALREALILLQEDGVITVRRGVGRTVNARPARRGFERLQPVEQLLGGDGAVVQPLVRAVEEPTDLVMQHLPVPARCEIRFWESVVAVDGVPSCLVEEWCVPDEALAAVDPALPGALTTAGAQPRTMLHAVTALHLPLSGTSSLTATVLGRRRGEVLGRSADTPVVLITQVVSVESAPLIAAKYALPSGAPGIPVRQSR